ncbi:hypothetical protein [Providencia vermicola]|uniref:tail fiber/spike domain-containing protein n=1 Tax=Providencia vermicola TaxID=333965 RepID=UPI0034D516B5
MREVKPTQKPVPSSDIKDLFFNSGLLDIWATSLEHKYIDRFGNCHLTAAGMEWLFKELVETFKVDMNTAIVAAGYITIDSFQKGADLPNNEITLRNHILRDEANGEYYRWDGDLPKQVLAGSTPQSTGGIGKGAWVSVGDASLRTQLNQERRNEWPTLGSFQSLESNSCPSGKTTIKVGLLTLINWKIDGDFSKLAHTFESEPIKNEFDEYIIKTNNGDYTFVTQEIYDLRMDKKLSGWGYPANDDFPASLIKSLNALSTTFIDVPISITKDTVIDCNQIKSIASNIISDKNINTAINISADCRLFMKSPTNIDFDGVVFNGLEPATLMSQVRTGVWATNFNGLRYIDCKVIGFGDPINYTGGTCALWFAAQATTGAPEFIQTGNSIKGRVTNCEFEATGDRTTNFAVRAYTPFDSAEATCTDVIVEGSTFTGYNWNAVEFGGLGVQYCKMINNTAYKCGLTPFDLDKGCSYCEIDNCLVDGLRGNINTIAQPNTNAVAWHVQGVDASSGYAHHNKITNCRTVFYLSDMIAYPNEYALTSSAYSYSSEIKGVSLKVIYDVPKSDYIATKKKLYAVIFDTITDNVFENINSNFFTNGVFQFAGTNANLYPVSPCRFIGIRSDESLTGEYINIQRGVSAARQGQFVFDGLNMQTNMTNKTANTPIAFDVSGSSTHMLKVLNSTFTTSGATNLISAKTGSLMLDNVSELGESIQSDALIASNSTLVNIAVTNTYAGIGRTAFDAVNLNIFENQSTLVCAEINDISQPVGGSFEMRSSSTSNQPCNIPASRFRGFASINSSVGINSGGRTFRSWVNSANLWKLTNELF